MGVTDLWLFIAASLLLNITPGSDMALVVARSSRQGTRAGVAAALGIGAGAFVHIAAAAFGLSALLMHSAWAFTVIKWLGAAFLVYVGLRMLWTSVQPVAPPSAAGMNAANLRAVFTQGFLTNVFNPKVALFFLAFVPQFIDAQAPSKAMTFVLLGCIFNTTGTMWNVAVAIVAGRFALSHAAGRASAWLERAIGALFVAIGVRLAMSERT